MNFSGFNFLANLVQTNVWFLYSCENIGKLPFSCYVFSQKVLFIDASKGPKCASDSENKFHKIFYKKY